VSTCSRITSALVEVKVPLDAQEGMPLALSSVIQVEHMSEHDMVVFFFHTICKWYGMHLSYMHAILPVCLTLSVYQVPWLLLKNIWRGNPWIKIDLCTGKLVEIGGD
jgi:hypothetical protein